MKIIEAKPTHASQIASLIMVAMNEECCQNLAGKDHSLQDFYMLLLDLVGMDESQYSYRNTLIAVDNQDSVLGICVSYDGSLLHQLRQAFIQGAKERFNIDYSDMVDETQEGELYVDSLAVRKEYRNQGIATALLQATAEKAFNMGIDKVGLLVDDGNPTAEKFYRNMGFEYVDDNVWGGHAMHHLQLPMNLSTPGDGD